MGKKNIYFYNLLKAPKAVFDKDYSFLISKLLAVRSRYASGEVPLSSFAEPVLEAFRTNGAFDHIHRVSFAIGDRQSKRLSVVSSSNGGQLGPNTIDKGYFCYVAENSSLFRMAPGEMRIYGDIDPIVALYENDGKPVQRSLQRLQTMGVKSGLSLYFEVAESIAGLVFLNSRSQNAFSKLDGSFYAILVLLKNLFQGVLFEELASLDRGMSSTERFIREHPVSRLIVSSVAYENVIREYVEHKKSPLSLRSTNKCEAVCLNSNGMMLHEVLHFLDDNALLPGKKRLSVGFQTYGPTLMCKLEREEFVHHDLDLEARPKTVAQRFFGVSWEKTEQCYELTMDMDNNINEAADYSIE